MGFPLDRHLKQSAFTIVEVLIVVFIIIVLSIIVLTNYEFGGYQLTLDRSAHKLAQDLRKAEEIAMSAEGEKEFPPGGYGLYFNLLNPTSYILFADKDGNHTYSGENEMIKRIEPEKDIYISSFWSSDGSMLTSLNITFSPPDPTVRINGNQTLSAIVTLESGKTGETVDVSVNSAGLIEIK